CAGKEATRSSAPETGVDPESIGACPASARARTPAAAASEAWPAACIEEPTRMAAPSHHRARTTDHVCAYRESPGRCDGVSRASADGAEQILTDTQSHIHPSWA